LPIFEKALQAEPRNLKAQANMASVLFDLRRYVDAGNAFAKAIAISPKDPDLRTNHALCLQKVGQVGTSKEGICHKRRKCARLRKRRLPARQTKSP
jgi:Tfp pilus assembly protein PilF